MPLSGGTLTGNLLMGTPTETSAKLFSIHRLYNDVQYSTDIFTANPITASTPAAKMRLFDVTSNTELAGMFVNTTGGYVNYGAENSYQILDASNYSSYALPISGGIMSGQLTVPTLRITSASDASLTSTAHGLQIGADNALRLLIDNNEIQTLQADGTAGAFAIQAEGGVTTVGGQLNVTGALYASYLTRVGVAAATAFAVGRISSSTDARAASFLGVVGVDSSYALTDCSLAVYCADNTTMASTAYFPNLPSGTHTAIGVTSNGAIFKASSALKYKDNVEDIVYDSSIVDKFSPKTFNYTKQLDVLSYGVVAEDVEEFAPELCLYDEKLDENNEPTGEKELESVNYQAINMLLLKEVQELRKRVAKLEG